MANLITQYHLQ